MESHVPKSKVRKKKVYTAPATAGGGSTRRRRPSPVVVPAAAVALILIGIVWLVTFYMSQGAWPIGAWGYWNLAIGFGAFVIALVLFTKWR